MGRKKVKINHDLCISCTACTGTYPEDLIVNDDGLVEAITGETEEDIVDVCPTGAIKIDEN